MIRSVSFRGDTGPVLTIPMGIDYTVSPFTIRNIDGLGFPDADVIIKPGARIPGGRVKSAKLQPRNLVFKLGFNDFFGGAALLPWANSIQGMRREFSSRIRPGSRVRVGVDSDAYSGSELVIDGTVESVTPAIFSEDPELVVSIMCDNPFFSLPYHLSITQATATEMTIVNAGDSPAGFEIVFTPGSPQTVRIESFDDRNVQRYMRVSRLAGHQVTDTYTVSTIPGSRFAFFTRPGGSQFNALREIYSPDWPILMPGSNRIRVRHDGLSTLVAGVRVYYYPNFGSL